MESKLRSCLKSTDSYENSKQFRNQVLNGDTELKHLIQSVVCGNLRDKQTEPITKLLSIQLIKDCIETFNDNFITQCQHTILPVIEKHALFAMESKDMDRGKFYFTNKPENDPQLAAIGNSFLRLILECIWVWSKWFPIDPETNQLSAYKVTYERLHRMGVQFPTLYYFKVRNIVKHLPEVMVPIGMLRQCGRVITKDLQQNKQSSTKIILQQLDVTLKSELMKMGSKDVFYAEILYRAYRKSRRASKKSVYSQISNLTKVPIEELKKMNTSQWQSVSSQNKYQIQEHLEELKNSKLQLQEKLKHQEQEILELRSELRQLKLSFENSERSKTQTLLNTKSVKSQVLPLTTSESQFSKVSFQPKEQLSRPPITPTRSSNQRSSSSTKSFTYEYSNPVKVVDNSFRQQISFKRDSSVSIVPANSMRTINTRLVI